MPLAGDKGKSFRSTSEMPWDAIQKQVKLFEGRMSTEVVVSWL